MFSEICGISEQQLLSYFSQTSLKIREIGVKKNHICEIREISVYYFTQSSVKSFKSSSKKNPNNINE